MTKGNSSLSPNHPALPGMTHTLPLLQDGLWDAFMALLFMEKLIHSVALDFCLMPRLCPQVTLHCYPSQACRELVSITFIIDTWSFYIPQTDLKLMNLLQQLPRNCGNDLPGLLCHMVGLQPSATMTSSTFSTVQSPLHLFCRDRRVMESEKY